MKKIFLYLTIMSFFAFWGFSCSSVSHVNSSGKVPPGQMKKMTGSQSAKPYAPGQQKKDKNQ